MNKTIKIHEAQNFKSIDSTKYSNGTLFFNSKSFGFLINGEIKEFFSKSEVQRMINNSIKKLEGK